MSETTKRKKVFREKSIERVSSPEELSDYIRVVNPGIWVFLSAIIVLLAGALVWCAVIKPETKTVPAAAVVSDGTLSLYVTEEGKADVREGMKLSVAENEYPLPAPEFSAVKLSAENDGAVMDIIGADGEERAYVFTFDTDLPDGVYNAEIIADEVSPLTLIFN